MAGNVAKEEGAKESTFGRAYDYQTTKNGREYMVRVGWNTSDFPCEPAYCMTNLPICKLGNR